MSISEKGNAAPEESELRMRKGPRFFSGLPAAWLPFKIKQPKEGFTKRRLCVWGRRGSSPEKGAERQEQGALWPHFSSAQHPSPKPHSTKSWTSSQIGHPSHLPPLIPSVTLLLRPPEKHHLNIPTIPFSSSSR